MFCLVGRARLQRAVSVLSVQVSYHLIDRRAHHSPKDEDLELPFQFAVGRRLEIVLLVERLGRLEELLRIGPGRNKKVRDEW